MGLGTGEANLGAGQASFGTDDAALTLDDPAPGGTVLSLPALGRVMLHFPVPDEPAPGAPAPDGTGCWADLTAVARLTDHECP